MGGLPWGSQEQQRQRMETEAQAQVETIGKPVWGLWLGTGEKSKGLASMMEAVVGPAEGSRPCIPQAGTALYPPPTPPHPHFHDNNWVTCIICNLSLM